MAATEAGAENAGSKRVFIWVLVGMGVILWTGAILLWIQHAPFTMVSSLFSIGVLQFAIAHMQVEKLKRGAPMLDANGKPKKVRPGAQFWVLLAIGVALVLGGFSAIIPHQDTKTPVPVSAWAAMGLGYAVLLANGFRWSKRKRELGG